MTDIGKREVLEYETGDEKSYKFLPLFGNTLRFSVKAAHDCHLAFTRGTAESEPMFEVFIGAWSGEASAIRFNKGEDLAKVDTPEILNDGEFREFWVTRVGKAVSVGKGGDSDPFLQAELPELVCSTHFGYSTGYGATGTFHFYSCQVFDSGVQYLMLVVKYLMKVFTVCDAGHQVFEDYA
ncbi:hypothetical protein HAZT_HAZT007288 [Hyalella azteca]|uniref:Farnesoic acid O-methyl transferase domain-containing protein n=1 Tax=Hyalella azteca TaxID=294128 RepID=A0A6A0H7E0_HYAAZ|nr:hypothetical protein HAZT_HAZT007288 [Hyalella azteca]